MADKRPLSPQQQAFLDFLYTDAKGDHRVAMNMAGYSKETRVYEVTRPLKDAIIEAAKESLAMTAPKATYGLHQAFDENPSPGQRDRTAAAIAIFDRIGIVKSEQVEVKAQSGGMFLLPPKEVPTDDSED